MCEAPIGVFDSGVGGLTVYRRIVELLPREAVVYLGDTARVPYGTKSADTVIRYARSCAGVLLARGVKMIVVACNTASAYALEALEAELAVPVVGVIAPGAATAAGISRGGRIGVIGTPGTIASGAYDRAIRGRRPDARVHAKACPLFVPLAEEGWTDGPVPLGAAQAYLEELRAAAVDTLVLGCTHYPLLAGVIGAVMGEGVALVDSARETARAVAKVVVERELLRKSSTRPDHRFLVSDDPENFMRIGRRFLDDVLPAVEWVDF
ncbi:MAG TPA: glutamate racemase [Candidatus Hydrogenedentes bacterium]|nr:glutamate racemase [Candidatus Hydrogenedentota bacterium]